MSKFVWTVCIHLNHALHHVLRPTMCRRPQKIWCLHGNKILKWARDARTADKIKLICIFSAFSLSLAWMKKEQRKWYILNNICSLNDTEISHLRARIFPMHFYSVGRPFVRLFVDQRELIRAYVDCFHPINMLLFDPGFECSDGWCG